MRWGRWVLMISGQFFFFFFPQREYCKERERESAVRLFPGQRIGKNAKCTFSSASFGSEWELCCWRRRAAPSTDHSRSTEAFRQAISLDPIRIAWWKKKKKNLWRYRETLKHFWGRRVGFVSKRRSAAVCKNEVHKHVQYLRRYLR